MSTGSLAAPGADGALGTGQGRLYCPDAGPPAAHLLPQGSLGPVGGPHTLQG